DDGDALPDRDAAVRALASLRDAITSGISPRAVLAWQEEQTRFAFQNGDAVFMRNWPYAYPLMQDPAQAAVAGRFAVAPMPAGPGRARAARVRPARRGAGPARRAGPRAPPARPRPRPARGRPRAAAPLSRPPRGRPAPAPSGRPAPGGSLLTPPCIRCSSWK